MNTTTTNSIVVPLASIDETETDDEDQFYSAQQPPEVSSASASSSGANSFIYKFSDLTSLSSVYSSSSGHTITSPVPPTFSHQLSSQHSRQPSTSSTFSSSSQYQYNHSFIVSPSTSDYFDDQTPTTSLSTTLAMIDAANRNSTSSSTAVAQDDEYCHDTGFFSSSMSSSSKRSSIDDISGTILAQHHHHRPHHHTSQHQTSLLSNNFYSMDFSMNNQIDESSDDDDEDDPDKLLIGDLILDNANIDTSNVLKNVEEQQQQQSQTQLAKSKLSNSLQDLVNSFDEKVKSCLRNYEENVSCLAPVQIRSPEEVIKDRPAWWTLTGNYGNILPIDWTKLTPTTDGTIIDHRDNVCLSSDDEIMMDDVDVDEEIYDDDEAEDEKLKHLISSCLELNYNRTPMKTADEVLKEIDAIIDAASSNGTGGSSTNCSASSVNSFQGRPVTSRSQHQQLHHRPLSHSSVRNSRSSRSSSLSSSVSGCYDSSSMYDVPIIKRLSFYPFALDKLKSFNLDQLQDLYEDLDHKVQKHSELLVKELATRDELEFEKEVKNTFLSLLILIQNRHRIEQKNRTVDERQRNNNDQINSVRRRKQLQFLTTVIPYQKNVTSNSVPTLQALIKILKAMNDDSPAVPNLLTDYILTYVCPTSNTGLSSLGPQNPQQQQKSAVNYLNSKISALSMMTSSATTGSYSKLKAAARLSFSSFSNQSQSKPTLEQHDNDVSMNMTRASETSNDNNNSNFDEDYLNDSLNNNNNGDNVDITTITTIAHHEHDNVNGKQVFSNNKSLQTNRSKFSLDSNAIVA